MKSRTIILDKARHQFDTSNIKRRRLKKCLKPLLVINDPEAILLLNILSKNNKENIIHDFKIAKQAAESNFPPAISNLAELYYNNGEKEQAYDLYHKAADLGEAHALYVLSALYKIGFDGYKQDLYLAKEYEEKASKAKKWDFISGYNDEFIMFQ